MEARDRYRIVGELGKGGVAEVLEALALGEHGFERRVAIKRLHAQLADEDTLMKAFIDEARIAAGLHHANIVGVLDFGIMDGAPFQVIELVDGLDARKLLDQLEAEGRPLPIELALYITHQVAQGLAHAHDATAPDGTPLGIVHRDVKPKNVLVSWTGDVKLADFGIAFAKKRLQITEVGFTKGTLRFMAPEQALGGGVDRRTDVFALGCTLHALIAGASPFGDELVERRPAISPRLPDDVRAIVEKATKNAKSDRQDSAEQIAAELARALARRTHDDPRASLKRFIEPLRPKKAAVVPKGRAMLDVALFLGDAVNSPSLRRFSSIAAPPSFEPSAEPTMEPVMEKTPAMEKTPVLEPTPPMDRTPILQRTYEAEEPTRATVVDPPGSTTLPAHLQFRPALPDRAVVLKNRPPMWRVIAWTALIVIGVANLTVMLLPKTELTAPVVPVEIPVLDSKAPVAQPRPVEPEPDRDPDPQPAVPPVVEKKRAPRDRAPVQEETPAPALATPSREDVRASLQAMRVRLEKLESRLKTEQLSALESRFLDLSAKEARAEDAKDMRALALAASALDAELRRLEAAPRSR